MLSTKPEDAAAAARPCSHASIAMPCTGGRVGGRARADVKNDKFRNRYGGTKTYGCNAWRYFGLADGMSIARAWACRRRCPNGRVQM